MFRCSRTTLVACFVVLSLIHSSHQVPVQGLQENGANLFHNSFPEMRFARVGAPAAAGGEAKGSGSEILTKFGDSVLKYANNEAKQAQANAMKFAEKGTATLISGMEAGMEAAKASAEEEKKDGGEVFKVEPAAEGGVKIEPAPGQNDPPISIRSPGEYLDTVKTTSDYIGGHSYQTDLKALLGEVDASENKAKGLKLRIVEKENFVDSLIKREDLLQDDLRRDKVAVENLHSHMKSLKARVERLKKEKQLSELEAQYHQYSAAASKVSSQAAELQDVKDALFSKMRSMHNEIAPLRQKEDVNMRLSINADPSAAVPQNGMMGGLPQMGGVPGMGMPGMPMVPPNGLMTPQGIPGAPPGVPAPEAAAATAPAKKKKT